MSISEVPLLAGGNPITRKLEFWISNTCVRRVPLH